MLIEEKKINNTVWYKSNKCLYRVKSDEDDAIIWVNYNGFNIVLPMLMWDFNVEMDENDIPLKLDMQWNEHRGFIINKQDISYFIGLINFFLTERDPNSMVLNESFSEEWYK